MTLECRDTKFVRYQTLVPFLSASQCFSQRLELQANLASILYYFAHLDKALEAIEG